MKKLLLTLVCATSLLATKAQMALNEVYVRPGNGQSEFFEIFNNAKTNININLDCFSALTYWKTNTNSRGWYVLDFGPTAIPPGGYFTAAASSPFNTQNNTNIVAGLNWNALPAGASLTKWEVNGTNTGYNQVAVPANLNEFFEDVNGIGMKNIVLLYKQSSFAQGFLAGSSTNVLPAEVSSLPSLTVATLGGCTSETYTFNNVSGSPFLYFANPAAGNDNGYSRLYDGNCAPWDKSAPGNAHTPNATNNNQGAGGVSPYDGTITTAQVLSCLTKTTSRISYDVTGVTGVATEANSFPVKVEFFNDLGTLGQYDPGVDVLLGTQNVNSIADPFATFDINSGSPAIIMLYTTVSGCYDKVFALTNSCATLPVTMTSFTAARSQTNITLKWETVTEINSRGFYIERNIDGVWQQIAFIPSQSINGNSTSLLTYTFTDVNAAKGISQYRLKQVDIDNKSKYSEIRSVIGYGQKVKTVVYPNPSSDGRVNVVFDDTKESKDITLIDAIGQTVKQWKKVTGNNILIDNLTPGMYSLRIVIPATGEQSVEKIVITKR